MADRRVRKTLAALQEAFISLVLARGYDAVTVEDIAAEADVARATFYKHYADKEALLTTLFESLTQELTDRLAAVEGAPDDVRTHLVEELYEHAGRYRDLYLVCLRGAANGRARAAYLKLIASAATTIFGERLRASEFDPPVPLAVISRAFAGAHVAVLEQWLETDPRPSATEATKQQMDLLTRGFGWALGIPGRSEPTTERSHGESARVRSTRA
jgi:AcrR family transcriptional regulator